MKWHVVLRVQKGVFVVIVLLFMFEMDEVGSMRREGACVEEHNVFGREGRGRRRVFAEVSHVSRMINEVRGSVVNV